MGRQIRRVPEDWDHPWQNGRFIPLLRGSFDEECDDWYSQARDWQDGGHKALAENPGLKQIYRWYHEYAGSPPEDRADYMEHFLDGRECTHWQLYEDVSEGTPVSPVFATREELIGWIRGSGGLAGWAADSIDECDWCSSAMAIV